MLENKDIDAVTLATPNHWHALGGIWAAQAGKDVYVEKPISHNIWEGRQLVEAARKYGRIMQAGTQTRSSHAIKEAIACCARAISARSNSRARCVTTAAPASARRLNR
jgi:predicted dehydrogenase